MNIDRENEKFSENVYKILQIKLPLSLVFREHKFNFLMSSVYAHQGTLLIFDFFIKFNYLNRTTGEFFQIVFDFVTFSTAT